MDGDVVAARADMPLGHKVARAFIPAGALVVKYGMPIGSATADRSEEHTSELQSLMRISYAVFCLKKKNSQDTTYNHTYRLIHATTTCISQLYCPTNLQPSHTPN